MNREDTLHTKIAGEHIKVKVTYTVFDDNYISFTVDTREEALLACYCYAGQLTRIEKATTGGWVVVVYKKAKQGE